MVGRTTTISSHTTRHAQRLGKLGHAIQAAATAAGGNVLVAPEQLQPASPASSPDGGLLSGQPKAGVSSFPGAVQVRSSGTPFRASACANDPSRDSLLHVATPFLRSAH